MKIFLFCTLLLLNSITVAQELHRNSLALNISKNDLDIFSGLSYSIILNHWIIGSGAELGVIRTGFQQRFFPRISIHGAYQIATFSKVGLATQLEYAFSFLNINKEVNQFLNYHEILPGIRFQYGKKWAFVSNVHFGYRYFQSFHVNYQKNFGRHLFAYKFQMGCVYAW